MNQPITNTRQDTLQLLVDNSVSALYLINRQKDIFLEVNPEMCKLTGYAQEELLSTSFRSMHLVHPDDRDKILLLRNKGENLSEHTGQFRIVRKDSSIRTVKSRVRIIRHMGKLVSVGSMEDITEKTEISIKNPASENSRETSHIDSDKMAALEAAKFNTRLLQIVECLRAVPELSKKLSSRDHISEVIKEACLYITNQDEGLQFGTCVIYLLKEDHLEVAYANPFRMTTRLSINEANPLFSDLLEGKESMVITEQGNRLVPIHAREGIIGILEVGIGKTLARIFEHDDPVRQAQENVIMSIADFIGIQIANLELRNAIQKQVIQDKLTGLYNRRHYDEKLASEFRRALRYERLLSLIILDVDHFKAINDTHGHPQGDLVLIEISKLLKDNFREIDTVCRIGGEEIAIIMPETSTQAAEAKARQTLELIANTSISLQRSQQLEAQKDSMRLTVSMGISSVGTTLIETHIDLHQEADRALFKAKELGRNRVCLAAEISSE